MVDFVDVGIECTLRQLLEHGYFHADPQCARARLLTLLRPFITAAAWALARSAHLALYLLPSPLCHLRHSNALCMLQVLDRLRYPASLIALRACLCGLQHSIN